MTTYRLSKEEVLQAIADFLSKKYGMSEKYKAHISIKTDEQGATVIVTDSEVSHE